LKLLAVHEDTNSNLAYFEDNTLRFAIAEERLTRKKFQAGFPSRAMSLVQSLFNVNARTVDLIVAGNPTHFLARLPGLLPAGEHDFFGVAHKVWLSVQDRYPSSAALTSFSSVISNAALTRKLGRSPRFVDHHTAHGYSTYLTSGFPDATVVSADNMGDGYAAKVFAGRNGRCEELYGSSAIRSPGQFYGEITQLLGFHCLMAGKVTGLAAYGDWRKAYPLVSQLFSLSADGTDFVVAPLWSRHRGRGVFAQLAQCSPADISAATQRRFEDVMVEYVRTAVRTTGQSRVAVAGGIFANVKLNQRIIECPEVTELFVHPAMSDQGIAAGAGYAVLAESGALQPTRLPHVFLGPSFSEEDMGLALDNAHLNYTRPDDLESAVVDLLLENHAVARFEGAMEYGPRALGHRTILYRPDDPEVNDWLNRKLHRSEFMPFAPVTLDEYADKCYLQVDKARYSAQFMTVCFECTEAMKKSSPGVVHVDGTARPQLITEAIDPGYYRIVKLFHERTGIPSLINTSFNMHGEPIVCTPADAVRSFVNGTLEYMAMGPFLVSAKKPPA
jgi:carbamoyltransferase